LTLPTTAGTNGYVLQTDGAGVTSWVAQSGGGGSPGGSSGQFQYNSSSAFAGANLWQATNVLREINSGALTTGQTFEVYYQTDATTPTTNYSYAVIDAGASSANVLKIGSLSAGSPAQKLTKLDIVVDGSRRLDYNITSTGIWSFGTGIACGNVNVNGWCSIYGVSNTVDSGLMLGSAMAVKWVSGSTNVSYGTAGDLSITRNAAGILEVNNGTATQYAGIRTGFHSVSIATKTGDYTLDSGTSKDTTIVCNGGATITLTLPTASSFTGRIIRLLTIAAQTVVSASSNVVPITGGAAGTGILAATAGKWADLQSDGTNWQIIAAN
jgi:hypothetical protein